MLKSETLKLVEAEFGFDVMIKVARIESLLHTLKPKISDLQEPGSFQARVERKFAKLLGEDATSAADAMRVYFAANEVEQRESLCGLGGCVTKTLLECLDLDSNRGRPFSS